MTYPPEPGCPAAASSAGKRSHGRRARRWLFGVSLAACVLGAGGCSGGGASQPRVVEVLAPPPTTLEIAPQAYERAFARTLDRLRIRGWIIDRVDAGAGVITTEPRPTAGLLTPFTRVAQTTADEARELVQPTQRRIRVTFRTVRGLAPYQAIDDAMTARIEVFEDRLFVPGQRVSPVSIALTSVSSDPQRVARGVDAPMAIPRGRDAKLETTIANDLARGDASVTRVFQ